MILSPHLAVFVKTKTLNVATLIRSVIEEKLSKEERLEAEIEKMSQGDQQSKVE